MSADAIYTVTAISAWLAIVAVLAWWCILTRTVPPADHVLIAVAGSMIAVFVWPLVALFVLLVAPAFLVRWLIERRDR